MTQPLRIGTRGSPLALAQANLVADALRAAHGWSEERIEIVPITTSGDIIQDRPLFEVGGKALWTKELDRCLAEARTDVSVHSMKDVEAFRPEGLCVAAMLPRADVRDSLVGAQSIDALPRAARVGTSSPRRAAQLLRRRPDLTITALRGNVATRIARLEAGEADAILLAAAGLERLGLAVGVPIDVGDMLPAPSQAAIGVETRSGDETVRALVAAIDHAPTHACVSAERRFLRALGGDCRSPVAALAQIEKGEILFRAEILTMDGGHCEAGEIRFSADDEVPPATLAAGLLERSPPPLRSLFAG